MKKQLLVSSLVLLTLPLAANEIDVDQSWAAGFIELYSPDNTKPAVNALDNGTGFGMEYGIHFNKNWAGRVEWSHLDLDGNMDGEGDRLGIDAMYFLDKAPMYVFAGIKHQNINTSYKLTNLGVGKHWFLSDNLRLVTEAAMYHDLGEDYTDYGVKLGLAYVFGKHTQSSPSRTKAVTLTADTSPQSIGDADADGVIDGRDMCPNTPTSDQVDDRGCSRFTEIEVSIQLNALFDNNSAVLNNPQDPQFGKFAEFMRRFSDTQAEIAGHTSAIGHSEYNQKLSQKRANAVRTLLIEMYHIPATRLQAKGYGEEQLLDPSDSQQAHTVNRRVEATVSALQKRKVVK